MFSKSKLGKYQTQRSGIVRVESRLTSVASSSPHSPGRTPSASSLREIAVLAMGEKGGKGFSLPKSSLKSTPADEVPKGKDDSTTKSKKGRKVHFNSEDSPEAKFTFSSKSGAEFDMKTGKANFGKGGKGDKIANGKKSSVSKQAEPLELKMERDLPKNAKCLMDCEAAEILQGIQEQMVVLSEDPTIKIPVSFDRGLQLAKTGSRYTNPQSVRQILDTLSKYGVSDGEICVIANVCPETVDEVFALVPSLKAKRNKLTEPLKDVVKKLVELKQIT